jgi:hypothetical protein
MDLHALTFPGAIGDLHFELGQLTGFDRLLCLLPERLRLEAVARKIVRDLASRGATFNRHITFRMPDGKGPWEVVLGPVIEVGKGSRQRSVTVRSWHA